MSDREKVNILLVDDQPAKLLTYEAILGSLGENVIKASSGTEALEQLLRNEITVVLMDVNMPELDGFELASIIRQHPRYQQTAIIFVSAVHLTDLDRLRGYETGAVDYVSVPVVPELLRAKVSVFVELYRKRRQWEQLNVELEMRVKERTAELEAAAARLRASEERFRFVAETVPSIVWAASPDGRLTYANRRWTEYCGLSSEEALANWPDFALHADDRERVMQLRSTYLARQEAFEIQARIRRYDGSYRWFVSRAVPRRGLNGDVLGWFGISTDVHDQVELAERLQEADRRKDEFLALLAHELRNPLAPLHNAVEFLRMRMPDDADLVRARSVIERQLNQLTRLVDDLLDVSRITRGKIKLKLERLDLRKVLGDAVETSRPVIDARKHQLSVDLPDEPVWIDGDLVRLTQVISNLLNNAAKYQNDDGQITLRLAAGSGEAIVSVVDNGVGIHPEQLHGVFDLFSQVETTLDRSQGGLGIGLALVSSIVAMHGGSVEARSDGPGLGSEFIVRLRYAARGDAAARVPAATTAARTEQLGMSLLVVDDNEDVAQSMSMVFRAHGCEVMVASDGMNAIDVAIANMPDAILLDIGMPGLDGYSVCRELRRQGLVRTVIVAMTGYGQERDKERSMEAGFDAHVVKPVTFPTLLRTLARLKERARPGSALDSSLISPASTAGPS